MSTRSPVRNLVTPLDNLELTIRRRTRVDPTLLNDFEMATNGKDDDVPPAGGGDLPVPGFRNMEELCQLTLNGRSQLAVEELWLDEPELGNPRLETEGVRKEIQMKGVIGDPIHFDALGDMQEFVKMLVSISQLAVEELWLDEPELGNPRHETEMNIASSSSSGTLPSNTITNPNKDLKGITTPSGIAYQGPTIPTTSSLPKVVERETEVTNDMVPHTNNESTNDVQPLVVQIETQIPNSEPVFAPIVEPVEAPTGRAFIDVYEGEFTLRVGNKAITFILDQTSRYFANYDAMSVNRIDIIDVACEEYSQEVLRFFMSGNPTPSTKPIVSISSPTLTPFGDSDLSYHLPPHLEYAFLKGDDKLPVIIAKDLKDEEKIALIKVLKSHKQALAWKLSDIKGINPEFCTHKILMEYDFKPAV
nr:hypothetical protein [Tanacetum cinerariifolium]